MKARMMISKSYASHRKSRCSGEDSVDGIANASLEINSGAGV